MVRKFRSCFLLIFSALSLEASPSIVCPSSKKSHWKNNLPMNFELNDVATSSSSSSSSRSSSPPSPIRDDAGIAGGDDGRDEVMGDLEYEIRSAMHLAVGRICRSVEEAEEVEGEDDASARSVGCGSEYDDDDGVGHGDGDGRASFAMSDGAIVALTDLVYHYATSCLANDLVSFSRHVGEKETDKTPTRDRPAGQGTRAPIKIVDGREWSPGVYRSLRLLGHSLEMAWEKAFIRASHF